MTTGRVYSYYMLVLEHGGPDSYEDRGGVQVARFRVTEEDIAELPELEGVHSVILSDGEVEVIR